MLQLLRVVRCCYWFQKKNWIKLGVSYQSLPFQLQNLTNMGLPWPSSMPHYAGREPWWTQSAPCSPASYPDGLWTSRSCFAASIILDSRASRSLTPRCSKVNVCHVYRVFQQSQDSVSAMWALLYPVEGINLSAFFFGATISSAATDLTFECCSNWDTEYLLLHPVQVSQCSWWVYESSQNITERTLQYTSLGKYLLAVCLCLEHSRTLQTTQKL
jgi:hypothetical protein